MWVSAVPAAGQATPAASPGSPARTRAAEATLDPFWIREVSGIVASRKRPGTFWAHGDSGNPSRIVAFDGTGKVLAEVDILGAPNIDWEDICADESGHLYIGDIGDGGAPSVRRIFKIAEPDPLEPPTEPVEVLEQYEFSYPAGKRFDMECLFCHADQLFVLAKSRWTSPALYRVVVGHGGAAELKQATTLRVPMATGADVSADGKRLVVSNYVGVFVFPIDGSAGLVKADDLQGVQFNVKGRVEGCCFAEDDVLLATEEGTLFRVTEDDIRTQARLTVTNPE